ncbi:MAG TPA: FAD-binding and (Fe-S)-binding domain-containing protein [Humibacter sp.]|nr:FAD-binding and (Fe-S)-binding domain-containing protein [Humibacter sp.]
MTTASLPAPRSRITSGGFDIRALAEQLETRVDGEVRFDAGSRAAYSTDASNYRQVPIAVVLPRTIEAGVATVAVCHDLQVPVLSRGGGTSLAGECCNEAVIIDWSKYCNRIVSVDASARTAVVEPGLVLDDLNRALASVGLMFGPKPATHSHCTIGGMIGNNSCGSSAQAFGKTGDNVRRIEILTYDGERIWVGPTTEAEFSRIIAAGGRTAELYRGMRQLAERYAADVRRVFPDIPRRVSGYAIDALLPENGFDVARALIGSEATLVTVLRAELALVPKPAASSLVVLGYPSIEDAADDAPRMARFDPLIIEGMDDTLVSNEQVAHDNSDAIGWLPEGKGWLIVELPGEDAREARDRAQRLAEEVAGRPDAPVSRVFGDPEQQRKIMRVREAGLGAAALRTGRPDAWAGWEDAAVPPDLLGDYLRDFGRLLDEFDYHDVARYGHFGHGCIHCRIPFDLTTAEGIAHYARFIEAAAHLVVSYGGSLSGEHGDGQARGGLLPIMFGDRVVRAFEELKDLFDPGNRMNPGKVVRPHSPTEDLRLGVGYDPRIDVKLNFSYPQDGGDFAHAALRCVGVGNCRSHTGDVMCPSYRATGEEEHSTRGRARLLFEMLQGRYRDGPITDGWRSTHVHDALDLCLACKGCKSDCPVDVDMATYKAEFLSHHYAGRLRPASHYTMGLLPLWARLAHLAPGAVNALTHTPGVSRLGKRLAGIEPDRPVPRFATKRFTDGFRSTAPRPPARHGDVLLWPDTFTNNFHPAVADAAVAVLEDAGYRVLVPPGGLCCALTWISTGQLTAARRILKRTAARLRPALRTGTPMVVLEPSCAAVFRSDAPELVAGDSDIDLVRRRTVTLAELLDGTDDWTPPTIGKTAVVQPHCHQHAVLGVAADERVMARADIRATSLEGCCGLAGNFGFEAGHLDVSLAVAEHALLPAVRGAAPADVILADGFSCRTQVEQAGEGRTAMHLAELLAAGISGTPLGDLPERAASARPGPDQHLPRHRILYRERV